MEFLLKVFSSETVLSVVGEEAVSAHPSVVAISSVVAIALTLGAAPPKMWLYHSVGFLDTSHRVHVFLHLLLEPVTEQ